MTNKSQIFDDEYFIQFKIKKLPWYLTLFIVTLMSLVLFVTDYLTGVDLSFSIFYLLPITFAVLFSGLLIGLVVSCLCAILWLFADLLGGHQYSHFIIPYWNALMRLGYFILHSILLSNLIKLYKATKIKSFMDPLTQTVNRDYFYLFFEKEVQRASRYNYSLTLAYIDLDYFKEVNDKYGHNTGDELLKIITTVVKSHIRVTDLIARLGGDEFAVLISETNYQKSQIVLNRIKEAIAAEMKKRSWPVTLSVGALTFKDANMSPSFILKKADELMYSVKKSGKNNIWHEQWEYAS